MHVGAVYPVEGLLQVIKKSSSMHFSKACQRMQYKIYNAKYTNDYECLTSHNNPLTIMYIRETFVAREAVA